MTTSLSIEEKIGQLFFIGIAGDKIDSETESLLRDISPGGVCLFARNCKNAQDIRTLLDGIRGIVPREPFLSLDQEGGLVDRLRRVVETMPSAAEVSAKGSAENVAKLAEITAELIRILGFNMNFAPVIDVIDESRVNNNNGALLSRAFGRSAEDVIRLGGRYADVLYKGGVMPCFKHFPGYGAIEIDAHDDLPEVSSDREEIFSGDLVPFKNLLSTKAAHAVMTGHAVFPRFDLQENDSGGKLLPTSLSFNIVTELLRNELKFEGLALTDDLEMGAIINHYGMAEAAKLAVKAGNDFLLICNERDSIYEGYEAILGAVKSGEISEERVDESLKRIETARESLKPPLDFDPERIAALSLEIAELKSIL